MRNEESPTIPIWLVVVIVLIIIIVFVVSLGSINPGNTVKFPDAFKESKEEAKRKHKRLKEHIDKQVALKIKLDKRFKRTYLFIRITLVLLWFGILGVLYFINLISNLSDALTYSEVLIILVLIANFITFGSITNMNEFIDSLKTKTENWIYGKYIILDNTIESNKAELVKLDKIIK